MSTSFLHRDVGPKIAEIATPFVEATAPILKPENFKELSSYNWIDSDIPTIVVPGAPAKWTPKQTPIRLKPDSGLYYIDQNRYRHPAFPLEPLFRSIYTLDSEFDPKSIDLFTDRNSLRKLLFAVSGLSVAEFRIGVEIIGNTLLFTRDEEKSSEVVTTFRGFGHEFERNFTEYPRLPSSRPTGHHRVVQYWLGGLTLVVRFDVDGYLDDNDDENPVQEATASDEIVSELTDSLALMQINQSRRLRIIRGGYKVSQKSIFELTSRAKHRPLQRSDVIYQLWLGQVPWLIVGYHVRGTFSRVQEANFKERGEFRKFEVEKKDEVTKLVRVIENIKAALQKAGKKSGTVIFENDGIQLYELLGNTRCLPEDLLKKWD